MRIARATALVLAGGAAVAALYQTGAIQLNRPSPEAFPVTGIDVSHHQGAIDWSKVAAAGTAFAYIKSTEGRDFLDPRFAQNWDGAAAAGIPRGAYHFFTFCSPGAAQAAHFLSVVPPAPDALTPVADVEFVGNCTTYGDLEAVRAELEAFVSVIERAWGRKPILYVTPDSLEKVIGSSLVGHPIWIRSVFSEPPLEAYRRWLLWQFSDTSRVSGISGPVDRNALRPDSSLHSLGLPGP